MNILNLGIVSYKNVLEVQNDLLNKRIEGKIPDTLILVEHEPVVTLGRTGKESSVVDRKFFEEKGIQIVPSGRGGKITYHAPGQLMMYPIIALVKDKQDISSYIDFLEKTTAKGLKKLGVPAERVQKNRGVWVHGKKIAFIGIAVKRWVTFHGAAVNINNDIAPFSYMYPCGERDTVVTSAREHLGRDIDMSMAKEIFAKQFAEDLKIEYGEKHATKIT